LALGNSEFQHRLFFIAVVGFQQNLNPFALLHRIRPIMLMENIFLASRKRAKSIDGSDSGDNQKSFKLGSGCQVASAT
jgi:hypothetical protein